MSTDFSNLAGNGQNHQLETLSGIFSVGEIEQLGIVGLRYFFIDHRKLWPELLLYRFFNLPMGLSILQR
jgi:hypothetical protein